MIRLLLSILIAAAVAGCTNAPPPPPQKNYQLEALQGDVAQIIRFVDNWSGYKQRFSRIGNLEEYEAVKRRIRSSAEYPRFAGRAEFEGKTNQFDAIVERYQIWVDERQKLLDEMERFARAYRERQKQIFATHARPLRVGSYEIVVANAYYAMAPLDPDQAYASARSIGLKQLDIIAASRDKPLRLPTLHITSFAVDFRITNNSQDRILRPNGFVTDHSGDKRISAPGSEIFQKQTHLVTFRDDRNNAYQFNRAYGVTSGDSENGIRPGDSAIWTYTFNRENHPLSTVRTFQAAFPKQVFGKGLKLSIPIEIIVRPELSAAFQP